MTSTNERIAEALKKLRGNSHSTKSHKTSNKHDKHNKRRAATPTHTNSPYGYKYRNRNTYITDREHNEPNKPSEPSKGHSFALRTNVTAQRSRLIRSISRESFFEFTKLMWDTVITEELVLNWHMEYLCDELQYCAERVFRNKPKRHDLIINIAPGSTKSTIMSVMYPAWIWTRMPHARILCASYTDELAVELGRLSRQVVTSDKYQLAFPEIRISDDTKGKGHYINTKRGKRYSVGVGGNVTGMHGHFLLVDDPLNPKAAAAPTEKELQEVNKWMNDTLPTRKVNKQVAFTGLLMQRMNENDPTGSKLKRAQKHGAGKVKHICIDSVLSDNIKPAYLKQFYVDGLMDPIRLPLEVLMEHEADMSPFAYAGQFRQSPIPLGGNLFKTGKFRYEDNSRGKKFIKVVRYWDKAATHGGGARTAGVKMAISVENGLPHIWVLDIHKGHWDTWEREQEIKRTAERDGRGVFIGIEEEPGSAGKDSARATIAMLRGYRVTAYKPTGDKAERAGPYSSQVNGENVTLVRANWNDEYIDECRHFPDGQYKDQVDASSGAFKMLGAKRKLGSIPSSTR